MPKSCHATKWFPFIRKCPFLKIGINSPCVYLKLTWNISRGLWVNFTAFYEEVKVFNLFQTENCISQTVTWIMLFYRNQWSFRKVIWSRTISQRCWCFQVSRKLANFISSNVMWEPVHHLGNNGTKAKENNHAAPTEFMVKADCILWLWFSSLCFFANLTIRSGKY